MGFQAKRGSHLVAQAVTVPVSDALGATVEEAAMAEAVAVALEAFPRP